MSARVALSPAAESGRGGGHIVRCLALARALERRGADSRFVVSPLGQDLLRRMGWRGAVSVFVDEAERRAALTGAEAVVLDDYGLDAAFEALIAAPVAVIDDLADRSHRCRLLIDTAYGRTAADYAALAPGADLRLGPTYALLRDGFAKAGRTLRTSVERALVCFGLSDVDDVTFRSLAALRAAASEIRIDVAVGSDLPALDRIGALAAADPAITLHLDADVAPLMQAADIGVGAGGGMVWERRAAGLPQLVVTVADNQRPMAARLAADGVIAAVDLGEPEFEPRLIQRFVGLLPLEARGAQVENPAARCDGLGADRAAAAVMALLA